MSEPWDVAPYVRRPSNPLIFAGVAFGVKGRLSPEELAAGNQRRQEIYQRECEEYKQRCKEAAAAWPRQRVALVQDRIEFLRLGQKTPGAENRRFESEFPDYRVGDSKHNCVNWTWHDDCHAGARGGFYRLPTCVYLMWCPTHGIYKIGHTEDLKTRTGCHQLKLDSAIEHRAIYYTPLDRKILEKLLLRHFDHFNVKVKRSRALFDLPQHVKLKHGKELFDLPRKEADGFEVAAWAIEQNVLAIEMLRLEALLLKFKAECK